MLTVSIFYWCSFVAFVYYTLFMCNQILSSSPWLCRWYLTDWISATRRSPAQQLLSIAGYSLYSMLRDDWSTGVSVSTMWRRFCVTSIGWRCRRESPISWPWLSSGAYTATTCSVSQKSLMEQSANWRHVRNNFAFICSRLKSFIFCFFPCMTCVRLTLTLFSAFAVCIWLTALKIFLM